MNVSNSTSTSKASSQSKHRKGKTTVSPQPTASVSAKSRPIRFIHVRRAAYSYTPEEERFLACMISEPDVFKILDDCENYCAVDGVEPTRLQTHQVLASKFNIQFANAQITQEQLMVKVRHMITQFHNAESAAAAASLQQRNENGAAGTNNTSTSGKPSNKHCHFYDQMEPLWSNSKTLESLRKKQKGMNKPWSVHQHNSTASSADSDDTHPASSPPSPLPPISSPVADSSADASDLGAGNVVSSVAGRHVSTSGDLDSTLQDPLDALNDEIHEPLDSSSSGLMVGKQADTPSQPPGHRLFSPVSSTSPNLPVPPSTSRAPSPSPTSPMPNAPLGHPAPSVSGTLTVSPVQLEPAIPPIPDTPPIGQVAPTRSRPSAKAGRSKFRVFAAPGITLRRPVPKLLHDPPVPPVPRAPSPPPSQQQQPPPPPQSTPEQTKDTGPPPTSQEPMDHPNDQFQPPGSNTTHMSGEGGMSGEQGEAMARYMDQELRYKELELQNTKEQVRLEKYRIKRIKLEIHRSKELRRK